MDTLKIKALLCAIEKKSLSKAAEEFSYTPSAFSHIADSVEEELGVKLLRRTHAGVELTEAGEALLEKLRGVVKAEEELLAAASALANDEESELRIAAYSSISLHLLPEIIKAFRLSHPNVTVSISVGNNLKNLLEEDGADIIFSDTPALGNSEWHPITNDPFVAVVPTAFFPNEKSIRAEALYAYPYITTKESLLNGYFDEKRFQQIIRFASVDDNSVLSMVKEELGVAVLPSLTVKRKVKGVKTLKLEPEISRTIGYSYPRTHKKKSLAAFIGFLQKEY